MRWGRVRRCRAEVAGVGDRGGALVWVWVCVWVAQRPVNDWRTGNCVADAWQRRGRSEAGLHPLSDGTVLTNPRTGGRTGVVLASVTTDQRRNAVNSRCGAAGAGVVRDAATTGQRRSGVGASEAVRQGWGQAGSHCGHDRSATERVVDPRRERRKRSGPVHGRLQPIGDGIWRADSRCRWPSPARSRLSHNRSATEWCERMAGLIAGAGSVPDWPTTDQRRSGVGASEAVRQGRGRAGSHCGHDRSATERVVDRDASGTEGRAPYTGGYN
jgi:hypothetical protein